MTAIDRRDRLRRALVAATRDLPITPAELHAELAPDDLDDLDAGRIGVRHLSAFARLRAPLILDRRPI